MPVLTANDFRSAKDSKFRIGTGAGALIVPFARCNLDPKVQDLDGATSESEGFEYPEAGFLGCDLSIEGPLDFANIPFGWANTPLFPSQEFDDVFVYLNGIPSPYWHFKKIFIIGTPQNIDIRQLVPFSFNARSKGRFYTPTQTGGTP